MGARFARLRIAGFKSFADSVTLEILPGLTGIVGPNGCGKSNVAEALRWAMGEANVRHLRGGEMDDVIFAGTAGRPSRNLAEVALHLEGDMPPPFGDEAELQVVRRIERGAGSTYRVNGREARARDVQTLFADLASGARSSAMVSQGRVSSLVNARPEERRAVLEEAAGITGLHARRAEAETRLRAAETNLERAEERRLLLDRQLEGLRGQAKQAGRYRTVTEAALEAEAMLLALQLARAAVARTQAHDAMQSALAGIDRASGAFTSARIEAVAAAQALPELRDRESAAHTALERARLAQEGAAAEAARADAALAAAAQRQTQLTRDLAHAEGLLLSSQGEDERLAAELGRLVTEAEAFPALLEAARAEVEAAALALQTADQSSAEAASQAAEAVARSGAVKDLLDGATSRASRAREAHARLAAEHARAAAQIVPPARLDAIATELGLAERALSDARIELSRAETDRARAVPAATSARDTHSRLDAARHKVAAETDALTEVLAVQDGERWPPMVDRLTVPPGLEAALGAALGEELGAADNPAAARHWRALPPSPPQALPGQRLADVVRAPPQLDRALAGIGLVATDAEGDAAQTSLHPGQSLVSAAGAVWRWDGYTVRAGTPTTATVRLQQRNRLDDLRRRLAAAQHEAAEARATRDTAERFERESTAIEQQARVSLRAAETTAERARNVAQQLSAQAESAQARSLSLDEQLAALAPELEAAGAALEFARQEHAGRPEPAALRAAADQARAAVNAARAHEAGANRTFEGLQRAEQGRTARMAAIARERDDRRMRVADLAGRVTDLRSRSAESDAEWRRLAEMPDRAAEQAQQVRAALGAAEQLHQAARAVRVAGERTAEATAEAARLAEHATFAAREALVRAEGMQETAAQGYAAAETRAAERAGALPPFPPITDMSPSAEDRARNRLQRLTRERDDMGPVNLRAEIEAHTIETEIAVIVHERDELGTAIAKLRGSIGHLNREGRERLSAVFQQVDRHFQALFGRMFGGGRAHLALVGSDDPLQAGLEIYAQPPGKKLTALSLLSGGEQALTALSLIFAVFRCNPAPLCVLDEVDAPLDDANVERFCALLADMVQETRTRFLVVTHHQVTMARMDRLYGVTMQERGVSRLLSVDLSHATEMVEAVAAE